MGKINIGRMILGGIVAGISSGTSWVSAWMAGCCWPNAGVTR